jgi:uncharacterized protein (DUF1697 family)
VARSDLDQSGLETLVHEVIKHQFGGDIVVFARTIDQLHTILVRNPFPHADPTKLYFTLLAATPEAHVVNELPQDMRRITCECWMIRCTSCVPPNTPTSRSTTRLSNESFR